MERCDAGEGWKRLYGLSIPFIGIFALHPPSGVNAKVKIVLIFQFPLLGFLLCISPAWALRVALEVLAFQFPLLGFLLCISTYFIFPSCPASLAFNSLYWDFCFASSSRNLYKWVCNLINFQFPLLGFLLCIGSLFPAVKGVLLIAFNSLYWDFCFASL